MAGQLQARGGPHHGSHEGAGAHKFGTQTKSKWHSSDSHRCDEPARHPQSVVTECSPWGLAGREGYFVLFPVNCGDAPTETCHGIQKLVARGHLDLICQ